MQSLFDNGAPPPCPTPFNMAAHVLRHAARDPDGVALSIVGETRADWSFARLESAIRGVAAGLLAQGLEPGDRLLMRLGNRVDFPIVYLAAIAIDILPVPTSSQLTVREVDAIARDIAPALIVAQDGIALPSDPGCPVVGTGRLRDWQDLPPAPFAMGDPDRAAYIIYTSGTSGRPRAVVHAHRAIWARRMMVDGWCGLGAGDRLAHAGAFNWTYTLGTGLMDPWSVGATALIPQGAVPADMPGLLAEHDVTIFAAAPGVYRQMLRADMPPLPALRHALSAGEKLPERLREGWTQATGTPVFEAFGMSECSTFLSGCPARPAPPGALGYPQDGRRIAVIGANGTPVARGTPGTLAVSARDPGLMLGYLGAEDETRARFRGEWFLTGDTVAMAGDGAVTYLGRDDDMMNAGGYRVSPIEVEAAMTAHRSIAECAAVEVAVKADVSVIALFYVATDEIAAEELADFAARNLARYKTPRIFRRVDTLPRGANNKLLRRRLRQSYEAEHGET